jgi:hypothetical protein
MFEIAVKHILGESKTFGAAPPTIAIIPRCRSKGFHLHKATQSELFHRV